MQRHWMDIYLPKHIAPLHMYSIGVCTERLGIHVCLVQHVKNCSCVNLLSERWLNLVTFVNFVHIWPKFYFDARGKSEQSRKLIINMLWFPFPAVAASQPGSFCKIGFCWKSAENLSAGINLHLHQSWKERKFWKLLCDWNFQFGMTWWFVASHICKYDSCCSTVPYMSRVNSRFGGGMVLTRDIKW